MTPRTIGTDERRARLAARHHLAAGSQLTDPVEVAHAIVAYHATDPAAVYVSAAARTSFADPAAMDTALYVDRSLARVLGMRRTMFVVPTELLPVVQASCTDAIAARERKQTLKMIYEGGFTTDPEAWLEAAETATLHALAARGEATTRELGEDVPQLREQVAALAVSAYLARFKGISRKHTCSDPNVFFTWCVTRDVEPLAAQRSDLELFVRWMQETRRSKASTVARRMSVVAGFYRTRASPPCLGSFSDRVCAVRITYWLAPGRRVILLTVFYKTRRSEVAEVNRALMVQKECQAEHGHAQQTYDRRISDE